MYAKTIQTTTDYKDHKIHLVEAYKAGYNESEQTIEEENSALVDRVLRREIELQSIIANLGKMYSEDDIKQLTLKFLKIRHNDHGHKYYTEDELWLDWFEQNKK